MQGMGHHTVVVDVLASIKDEFAYAILLRLKRVDGWGVVLVRCIAAHNPHHKVQSYFVLKLLLYISFVLGDTPTFHVHVIVSNLLCVDQ